MLRGINEVNEVFLNLINILEPPRPKSQVFEFDNQVHLVLTNSKRY